MRRKPPGVLPSREAAVVLAIFADPPHHVVFVQRAYHLRDHPGQIGLPGGSVDPVDGDDRARTALRELQEELGIPPERMRLVGRLSQVRQRFNNFSVAPFVGVIAAGTKLVIDETETAGVFLVPLEAMLAPGAVRRGIEKIADRSIDTYLFDHADWHIWGLTGRVLHAFVTAWNDSTTGLRAATDAALQGRCG